MSIPPFNLNQPAPELWQALLDPRKLSNGVVEWYDNQHHHPVYCGRIDRTGLCHGNSQAGIFFQWIAAFDSNLHQWYKIWTKTNSVNITNGRSGQGLWQEPEPMGVEYGRIGIDYDTQATIVRQDHQVVVSHFDQDSQKWYGVDGIQPLTEYHYRHDHWQLVVISPIPYRPDQLPVALIKISDLVPPCKLNANREGVPYYTDLLQAA